RLLVVLASAPDWSRVWPVEGCSRMYAQPPGPGLPLQAPSVKSRTKSAGAEESVAMGVDPIGARQNQERPGRTALFARSSPSSIMFEEPGKSVRQSPGRFKLNTSGRPPRARPGY